MADNFYPPILKKLSSTLSQLPGIGRKTAERLALDLCDWPKEDLDKFSETLGSLTEELKYCKACGNFSQEDLCAICENPERDSKTLCVVETIPQISTIEKSGSFRGLYHIIGGRLSPLNGLGPDSLNISALKDRIQKEQVSEIILALSPDIEGEATASYICDYLKDEEVNISRIARGIPVGADISYADSASMAMAISQRSTL